MGYQIQKSIAPLKYSPAPPHPESDLARQRKTAPDGTIALKAVLEASFNGRSDEVQVRNGSVDLIGVYNWWKKEVPNTKVTYEEFKRKAFSGDTQEQWMQSIQASQGDRFKYNEKLRIYIPPGMRSQ